jgi:hypothetical protein
MPHRNTQNIVGMVAAERTGLSETGDFKLSLSLVLMLPSLASRAKPGSQLAPAPSKTAAGGENISLRRSRARAWLKTPEFAFRS